MSPTQPHPFFFFTIFGCNFGGCYASVTDHECRSDNTFSWRTVSQLKNQRCDYIKGRSSPSIYLFLALKHKLGGHTFKDDGNCRQISIHRPAKSVTSLSRTRNNQKVLVPQTSVFLSILNCEGIRRKNTIFFVKSLF